MLPPVDGRNQVQLAQEASYETPEANCLAWLGNLFPAGLILLLSLAMPDVLGTSRVVPASAPGLVVVGHTRLQIAATSYRC